MFTYCTTCLFIQRYGFMNSPYVMPLIITPLLYIYAIKNSCIILYLYMKCKCSNNFLETDRKKGRKKMIINVYNIEVLWHAFQYYSKILTISAIKYLREVNCIKKYTKTM